MRPMALAIPLPLGGGVHRTRTVTLIPVGIGRGVRESLHASEPLGVMGCGQFRFLCSFPGRSKQVFSRVE